MGNEVYANGRELSCKAANGKSICAFPDVCLSPPSPPAGPVPIPYPNTGMASDMTSGSKSVKISNQEVMLKDSSYFSNSTGDEACTKSFGMGVLTHTNTGKVYFTSWSMDVKIEGENAVRHLDMTTHNHNPVPGNTGPWPYIDAMAVPADHPCKDDADKEEAACKDFKPQGKKDACSLAGAVKKPSGLKTSKQASNMADRTAANECLAARRCKLQPYDRKKTKCCKGQTPHHLIEASAFFDKGRGGKKSVPVKGVKNYKEGDAPCVCAEGKNQNTGSHGLLHTFQSSSASKCKSGSITLRSGRKITAKKTTYAKARKNGAKAMNKVFPQSKCSSKCIEAQLDSYHKQCGVEDDTEIKAVETGDSTRQAVQDANQAIKDRSARVQAMRGAGGAGGR